MSSKNNAVIPIKIDVANHNNTKLIEWRLSNVCNYKCSFCPSIYNDGSNRFLKFSEYTKIIDQLFFNNESYKTWFQFTGGEPTLYPRIIDLLKYIKDKNGYTSIISNGSRTIRWWKELAKANVLNRLYLSQHSEMEPDPSHIIEVNDLMQATDCLVSIFVTAPSDKQTFNLALKNHYLILEKANTISHLKPISDLENFQEYTKDQWDIINKTLYSKSKKFIINQGIKNRYLSSIPWHTGQVTMTFSDFSTETNYPQYFIEKKLHNFENWQCDIGKNSLVIEYDKIYRGICKEGGILCKISDPISYAENAIICKKNSCNCSSDFYSNKKLLNTAHK